MKTGFIYAGQGQQFLDMGKDLVSEYSLAKSIYEEASYITNYDILNFNEEELANTKYTQIAIYTLNYIVDKLLENKNIKADYVCGLSLGEYNALVNSEVISFNDGLEIIKERAIIMSEAYAPYETGLMAVLKTNKDEVNNLIKDTSVEIANYNTDSQIVIGGYTSELLKLRKIFKENRILAIPLKVSIVSHTSLLQAASNELYEVLKTYTFAKPIKPFINNLEAKIQSDHFSESLSKHIRSSTHLNESIKLMYENGVRRFVEVGVKGSISKLIKEILKDKEIEIINVYDLKTLEGVNNE